MDIWKCNFFSAIVPFPSTCSHCPRLCVPALITVMHRSTTVVRQLWLSCLIPSSLCLFSISACWSREKCLAQISPQKLKCCKKSVCWISNLCHNCLREELHVPVPNDIGTSVQMPLSNSSTSLKSFTTSTKICHWKALRQYTFALPVQFKKEADVNLVPAALCRMRCLLPTSLHSDVVHHTVTKANSEKQQHQSCP